MSAMDSNNNSQGSPLAVEPQDEQLPVPLLITVATVGLLVFAAGVFWSVQIQTSVEGEIKETLGVALEPLEIGKPEIGIVDQTQFTIERRAADMRQAKGEHLQAAGWVSQRQQIIHVPITTAMDAVAAGKQVRTPAPQGQPAQAPAGDAGTPAPSPTLPQ